MFQKLLKNLNKKKLKDKRFEFLFDEAPKNEYICLDCETSGLNPKKDEILSIGAVHIKDNKILMSKTFNIFLKPSKNIDSESIKIHHIRPVDLENGIEPQNAIFQLLNFIGSRTIVGYYIEFDIAIISKYTQKLIGMK
jgi:DNA polymerase-3 subunit epsilon